jgi:sugar phosphate permease
MIPSLRLIKLPLSSEFLQMVAPFTPLCLRAHHISKIYPILLAKGAALIYASSAGGRTLHDAIGSLPLSAPARAGTRARWPVTAMLLLAVTTAFFDRINVAVLFTNRDFQDAIGVSSLATMSLLMTAFVFPYGASAMLFSVAGDALGPRRTLSAIAVILAGLMALMGAASSYALMIVARILIGVTEGPQFGTATVTIKRWFPPQEQGLANAFWTIGSPLGSMIGFPLVIFLVASFGWRASFFALAALNVLVVFPVLWLFLRDAPPDALAPAPSKEPPVPFGEAFRMLARDWRFWLLPIFNSGTLIYLWGLNSWLPTYLQEARHFNVAMTSFYSALPFAFMIVGQIFFSWLGDRSGRRALVCGFTQAMAGVFIYLTAIAPDANLAAWCLALSAGFWGGATPSLFALGCQIIPARITGAGFGLYAGTANLVGSSAPFIIGVLVTRTGDFQAGLIFLVLCCLVTSLAMLPLMRKY